MAKSPNTTPFSGINHKFTIDYPGWENNFINALYNSVANDQPKLTEAQRIETENELAWLDYVESEFIQDMLTYPDSEAIIKRVMKNSGESK
jgi:hypothetical protein|tara:strand:+ start:4648 stop:4920 length:273 start_codon:yes stop_codon:yes gene_type:complete